MIWHFSLQPRDLEIARLKEACRNLEKERRKEARLLTRVANRLPGAKVVSKRRSADTDASDSGCDSSTDGSSSDETSEPRKKRLKTGARSAQARLRVQPGLDCFEVAADAEWRKARVQYEEDWHRDTDVARAHDDETVWIARWKGHRFSRHSECEVRFDGDSDAEVAQSEVEDSDSDAEGRSARPASGGAKAVEMPYRCRAKVECHPKLQGQKGVFCTSTVKAGDVVYMEEAPLVDELPSELDDTDHYIQLTRGPKRKQKFAILKDTSRGMLTMSYNLNSAAARKEGPNVLDSHLLGPNVDLSPSTWKGSTYLVCRAKRQIMPGNELLWTYPLD